jgi:hypothetical protein
MLEHHEYRFPPYPSWRAIDPVHPAANSTQEDASSSSSKEELRRAFSELGTLRSFSRFLPAKRQRAVDFASKTLYVTRDAVHSSVTGVYKHVALQMT